MGLRLFFLPKFPGAMFIQGATFIPDSRVYKLCHYLVFYLYFFQELKPTLDELGISLPEELGYDKPELMLQNPYLDNV